MISMHTGRDLGLWAGGWDMAIACDVTDAAAYRAYDEDTEHERIRREMFGPVCSEIARVQIDLA